VRGRLLERVLPPFAALTLLLAIWEASVRVFGVALFLLPPPSAVASSAATDAGRLAMAAFWTARAALTGFAASAVLGVAVAIALASSRLLERALYPYTVFFQTVPIIAIAPILVVWFGPGFKSIVIAALIVSVFPVIANTLSGLRAVDPALRDLFRLYGATRAAALWKLELPSALPQIVTGLRVAAGLAVVGTLVGEFFAGFSENEAGLGITVMEASKQMRTDLLFAAVLAACLLGLAVFGAVNLAGNLLLRRWHPSEKS
jgi:NitT/TauT family transport system permease protein